MSSSGPVEEAMTRLLSTSLRHGTNSSFIVEQLDSAKGGDLLSFEKAIARVLKKYITDGTKVHGEDCLNCDSVGSLIRQEGCVMCQNCGWSRCS